MKKYAISLKIRKSIEVGEDVTDEEAKEKLVEWMHNLKIPKEQIRTQAEFLVERNPWLPLSGKVEKVK